MNVEEFMRKHALTDAALDEMAAPYENGTFELSGGAARHGSHLDAVGKRRVTVIYDAATTSRVDAVARSRGAKPSAIYRDAMDSYLAALA